MTTNLYEDQVVTLTAVADSENTDTAKLLRGIIDEKYGVPVKIDDK